MGTYRKGNACHKNLSAIMANSGFGDLKIKVGDMSIVIPPEGITKDGRIKKTHLLRIQKMRIDALV